MKELVKQYLDHGISRRQLMSGLGAAGLSTVAAKSMAQSLSQVSPPPAAPAAAGTVRTVEGTGGDLFVAQLRAAGVKYVFFNPSTGDHSIFDAMVDVPDIQLIKGVQEGAVIAMADGYARASGKVGVAIVANIGLPNAMTQMINTWKDQIPLLLAVGTIPQDSLGRENFQETDHSEYMTQPITKWHWLAQTTESIPETVRRGLKFASTPPCGPVFLSLPGNILDGHGKANVIDQAKFDVPMRIRPDKADVEAAARMLIEAQNPLMSVGDELGWNGGWKEVVALAELLGMPVTGQTGPLGYWSRPFPTRHPLFLGTQLGTMRFPGKVDVLLNIGNKYGERAGPGTKLISIRMDPTSLARVSPVDLGMVADPRLAAQDLIEAVKSLATESRLKQIASERFERTRAYTNEMREFRSKISREVADGAPVSLERLGLELEASLAPDTIYVADVDSGKTMETVMSFGGDDKRYIGTGPSILGWGMAAAFGAKLAQPDKPVISVVGDGSFLFSGPQPLWSMARYKAPVTVFVLNNHSYNNERNRIWNSGGRQFKAARDMTCYLGSPDVDYAKTAQAFGVDGEVVKSPDQLKGALSRAEKARVDGRPYLLDVHTRREGLGAVSEWHPEYSIAALRTRKV
jgi:thiamine pyrophosphate-dependent acetolactate synthase large subunit-like protein